MGRCSIPLHRLFHLRDDVHGSDRPRHVHGKAFSRVFINECQHSKARSVLSLIFYKVPAPHFIGLRGSPTFGRGQAQPLHSALFTGHFISFLTTQPLHALGVHFKPITPQ